MTAEYQGKGTWLVNVSGKSGVIEFDSVGLVGGESFFEQWLVFESGRTPPRKMPDP